MVTDRGLVHTQKTYSEQKVILQLFTMQVPTTPKQNHLIHSRMIKNSGLKIPVFSKSLHKI